MSEPAPPDVAALREMARARAGEPVWVTWEWTRRPPDIPDRVGGLRGRMARAMVGWLGKSWTASGVLDAPGRRFALDMGEYAIVHIDGQEWRGRSGSRLAQRYAKAEPDPRPLELLHAAVRATAVVPATDPALGSFGFLLRDTRNFGMTVQSDQLRSVACRDTAAADQRLDLLRFDDATAVPDYEWTHLPDWASESAGRQRLT